jgi:interferon, gamma-inducible protein 30
MVFLHAVQGNAKMGPDGTPKCQHGSSECEMNAVARCAIDQLPPAALSGPPRALHPLACILHPVLKSHPNAEKMRAIAQGCLITAGLSWAVVESCVNSPRGKELTREAWLETEALQPKKTWVPWVTVDGKAINAGEMSQAALLPRAICAAYKGKRHVLCPPVMCSTMATSSLC